MSNAFAPIVRARPNPIFGRPVHQGSPPIDYSPILLLKPFGFRIAPDTLSSDENLVGQRGITPAFGYSAPHPSAGGTLTLLIHALPSAHYGHHPPVRRKCDPGPLSVVRTENGFETSSSAPDRQRFRGFVQDGVRAPVERGGIIEHLLVLGGEIDLPRGNSTSRRSPPNETAPHA